jgi:hypothetical protein
MDYDCKKCNHLPICMWHDTEFQPTMCPHYEPEALASPAPAVDAGKGCGTCAVKVCCAGVCNPSNGWKEYVSKPAADKEG